MHSESYWETKQAEPTRQELLFEIARVFKRASKADRCWLVDRIKEAQERVHNRAKKDLVDQALDIAGA